MNRATGVLAPLAAVLAASLLAGGCANLGVTPFPKDVDPGHGMKHGLDPFPDHALNPRPTKSMNWTAFPKPKEDSGRRIGLDPFPLGKKKDADGCGGRCGAGCAMPCCAGKAPAAPKTMVVRAKAGAAPAVALVAVAPPAAAAAPKAPEGVTLALKFVEGATRRYRMDMDTLVKTPMFGEEGMAMKMGMGMKQTIGKVREDRAATVISSFESVSMEMNNPMTGMIRLDTADEASMKEAESNPMLGQMAAGFKQIIGKSMEMTISPEGEVLGTAGVDELMSGLGGGMGGGASGANLTGLPASFPAGAVKQGTEWPFEAAQESPMGRMVTKGMMKVKSLDEAAGIAVLVIDGVVTVEPAGEPDPEDMQAQMMAMIKIKNAKTSGEITFDVRNGCLRNSVTTMTMDMENPMLGGDMSVDAKVTLTLVE